MGVKGLNTWITANFANVMQQLDGRSQTQSYDHVLVDLNGVVHAACRRRKKEQDVIRAVFQEVDLVVRLFSPRATLLLALDGPAPLAKMATQRERRRKSADKSTEKGLSPLYATPGTSFMQRLEEALVYFCCEQLCTQRGSGLTFHVSGAETPGEGEFKLLEWLLAQDPPRGG